MTGFGRGEYSDELRTVTVEIKSVNHRYSDITVKMPRRYQYAEEAIKAEKPELFASTNPYVTKTVEELLNNSNAQNPLLQKLFPLQF